LDKETGTGKCLYRKIISATFFLLQLITVLAKGGSKFIP